MAKELEVKVLGINRKEIEEKLTNIDAIKIKDEYQKNIILDTEDNIIEEKYNGYLRIRETKNYMNNEKKINVTLKQILSDEIYRENKEFESSIDNPKALLEIFKILGLTIKYIGYKERVSYKYEDILFEIDTWDNDTYPETYMEIEIQRKDDLDKAINMLNLDKNSITTKSITELRKEIGME
ncbi:class IV adenylate cyclase [Clostridium sp. D2Q-14]|uniref:class IV adenylate cyclase n=1 Tax=Anaeromonas gelatinilytica TaxID=2683194 RepID=UPI00193C84D1|nr:class IV adenylate cyclase [Anaeromonas gelatinilytica]MBS4534301.1 class IV adenylate cyclase [Anaeromonas gelatinilytica]